MQSKRFAILLVCMLYSWYGTAQLNADFIADEIAGCNPLLVQFTDISQGNPVDWNWTLGDVDAGPNTGPISILQNPGRVYSGAGFYSVCLTVTDAQGNTDTACKINYINVFNSPEADIQADVQEGCEPQTVVFTDASIPGDGTIIQWQWDLNNTSTVPGNPTVSTTYEMAGLYSATLIVTDDNNCSDFINIDDFINVLELPDASFSADVTGSCDPPLNVNFSNNINNTNNISFQWDFGDGMTSNAPNPSHNYPDPGDYDVTLITLNNITGCTDTSTVDNYINIGNAVNFSYDPPFGCDELTVQFTDLTAGIPYEWNWDFGDGTGTSNDQNPVYTYTQPGCYTVTLTATNDECTSTRIAEQCINVAVSPSVSFTSSEDAACDLPFSVNFSGFSDNPGSWEWDFGDSIGTANTQNATYTFTSFGQHNVTLTMTSPEGCSNTYNQLIDVRPLEADFIANTYDGCAPLTVNFTDVSSSVVPVVDWEWDFMDGNTTSGPTPSNTFEQVGVYPVTLIATNQLGCTDTVQNNIYVGEPRNFSFSAEPPISCADTAITFTVDVDGAANGWYWDFGDGGESLLSNPTHVYIDTGYFDVCLTVFHNGCPSTLCEEDFIYIYPPVAKFSFFQNCFQPYTVTMQNNSIGGDSFYWDFGVPNIDTDTSTLIVPTYVYDNSGTYTITLTTTNDSTGCVHTTQKEITIADPQANFIIEPDTICIPMAVSLTDDSQDAVSWQWSSPDGVFADDTLPQTTILYNTPGLYSDIELMVTDIHGCTDSYVYTGDILATEITADFTADNVSGCTPVTTTFTDLSTSSDGEIVSWLWYFGDGDSSTVQNPVHEYTVPGSYDITLIVTSISGCTDELIIDDLVQPTYPSAEFEAPEYLCTGQPGQFNSLTMGVGLSYLWDFGDGNTSTVENPSHAYENEGMYTICLTATDINSCVDSICIQNYVTVLDPISNFTADTTYAACPPLIVTFQELSTNAVDWLWDFGDDSGIVSGQSPVHIYTEPGVYDVCMISVSASGCQDTLCFEEYIQLDGPIGSFTFEPNTGCAPLEVSLYGEGVDVVKWNWDSGCGDIQVNFNDAPTDTASFTYTEAGECFPFVVIEDIAGCQRVITSDDPVIVDTLSIDFIQDVSELCENGTVNYSMMVGSSDLPNVDFYWEFPGGDPATSTSINPTVNYANTGTYDATLIVSTTYCSDTLTKPSAVIVADDPVADFSFTPLTGCHPLPIQFNDLSTSQYGAIVWWEWDFGNGDVSTEPSPSYTYPMPGTYNISLLVVTEYACSNTITQTIEVLETPVADAGSGDVLCIGESIQLNATGGDTYSWAPANNLSCTNCPNPIADPVLTTTYEVTVTTLNGCTDTDTVTVDVLPFAIPDITLSSDTVVCEDGFVQLFVSTNTPNVTFVWDNIPGLSCYENCFNPFATPDLTTTYYVTAIGEGGCNARDSVVVAMLGESNEIASPDQVICKGDSVQLTVDPGANVFWSPSIGLSCAYCPDPYVYPEYSVTYIVELTTLGGCTISDTVQVEVLEQSDIDAGLDQYICIGEEIQLDGIGPPPGNILWTPGNTLDDSLSYTPIAVPEQSTTYTLAYLNGNCIIEDSVRIEVLEEAVVPDSQVVICVGDTVQLDATGIADTYSWAPENSLSNAGIPTPLAFPEETTIYQVTGTYNTCLPGIGEVIVTVNPIPEIQTNIQAASFFQGANIELIVEPLQPGNYTYQWFPNIYLSCDDCPTTIAEPEEDITYSIEVTDEFGCKNTADIELRMQRECTNDLIVIPNGFTPNNDGRNDVLYVRGSTLNDLTIFRIYDRWGALVFESSSLADGWDGNYKGQPAAPGVYVYYAEAPCALDGSPLFKKGNVTLIR